MKNTFYAHCIKQINYNDKYFSTKLKFLLKHLLDALEYMFDYTHHSLF